MTEPEVDYATVFQALPGAVALLTPELIFVDVNPELMRIAGRTREQLVGRSMLEDRSANDRPYLLKALASLRKVADTGERDTLEDH